MPKEETAVLTKGAAGPPGPVVDPLRLLARLIVRELRGYSELGEVSVDACRSRRLSSEGGGKRG